MPADRITRPDDDIHLMIDTAKGKRLRHWTISQPRASVCATLRGQIIAACGEAVNEWLIRILVQDEEVEAARADIDERDREAGAKILRLLRNASAGRALRGFAGGAVETLVEETRAADGTVRTRHRMVPGVSMAAAVDALRTSALWMLTRAKLRAPGSVLFGTVEDGEIKRPGLLWQLAYASDLRYRTEDDSDQDLIDARAAGFLPWVRALDEFSLVGEQEVLFAFCLLHTWRPF